MDSGKLFTSNTNDNTALLNDVDFYLYDLKSRFKGINFDEYYLSYSGGKDSHFLYWFIKEYLHDEQIKVVGINTYMEHEEIRARIYQYCDVVLLPEMKPKEIKEMYGSPCFSKSQDEIIDRYQRGLRTESTMQRVLGKEKSFYNLNKQARELLLSDKLHKVSHKCCMYLKKKPLHAYSKQSGRKAILGVRRTESKSRSAKYNKCLHKNGNFTPIYDLSDALLDDIYKKYQIEIPNVYQYVSRTGCMGCPYGTWKDETKIELDLLNDNQRNFIIAYFKESYDVLGIDYSYKQFNIDDFIKEAEEIENE